MKKILYYFIILLFLIVPLVNVKSETQNLAPHKSGELLVKLKSSENIYKFKFNNQEDLIKLIDFYNSQPQVEYAEPNYTYKASLEPLDTYYTQQLYLSHIKAHQAWNITTGSENVTIAIIDSGVDIDHPDLKNNIWINPNEIANNGIDDDENGFTDDVNGWDFITSTNDPEPKTNENYSTTAIKHGTVVAGIAAAEGGNKQGIAGINWKAKIMSLKVLDSEGIGDTLTVAKAIDYAREQGADIINLSFVGSGLSTTLETAIKNAHDAGILIIAAAGNEVAMGVNMDDNPQYPVCHNGPNNENWVIGVASIDKNDLLASFSNYGKNCVDIVAPGVTLFSTIYQDENNSDFQKYYDSGWTGTSVSAPQVVGTAALIKSMKPNLSLSQIKDIILNNADNIDNKNNQYRGLLGHGRLNVYASLSKTLVEKPSQSIVSKIVSSPAQSGGPHVRIFKKSNLENQFFAFEEDFRGNLSVAAGDIDNDGESEIIVGLGQGTFPWVKIFKQDNILKDKIVAYNENFRGGVEVAVCDTDGDNQLEIVTAPGKGGGPHVRIFSSTGQLKGQFFAFDESERTGLEIACGDVNQDNKDEIIVTRKSGDSEVRIFDYRTHQISNFKAYAEDFNYGVHLAAGDLDGDGIVEIVTGAGQGGSPHVKVFDYIGKLKTQFNSYAQSFRGGSYVAVGDVDGDGSQEIVTGAGTTGGPHVRVFTMNGEVKFQFFAYDEMFRGGVRVATEK